MTVTGRQLWAAAALGVGHVFVRWSLMYALRGSDGASWPVAIALWIPLLGILCSLGYVAGSLRKTYVLASVFVLIDVTAAALRDWATSTGPNVFTVAFGIYFLTTLGFAIVFASPGVMIAERRAKRA